MLQKVPMQGEKPGLRITFTGELSLSIGIAIKNEGFSFRQSN